MNKRHTDKFFEDRINKGRERVQKENVVLAYMFSSAPEITFNSEEDTFDDMLTMVAQCGLHNYVDGSYLDTPAYKEFSREVKDYYNCLAVLDALEARGLVSSQLGYVTSQIAKQSSQEELDELAATYFYIKDHLALFLREQINNPRLPKELNIGQIRCISKRYFLTEKGYDVALTLKLHDEKAEEFQQQKTLAEQQHQDQQQQFQENKMLTEQAVSTSKSSARTAKIALFAAYVIAITSFGNLVINIHSCVKVPTLTKQNETVNTREVKKLPAQRPPDQPPVNLPSSSSGD